MVEKRSKIITKTDDITYTINRYVDVNREYDNISGAKKSDILNAYSEAKQRNLIAKAVLAIANELDLNENIDIKELSEMVSYITGK